MLMSNSNPNYTAVKLFVKQVPKEDLVLCATCEAVICHLIIGSSMVVQGDRSTRPVAAGSEETFTKLSDLAQIYRKLYIIFMFVSKVVNPSITKSEISQGVCANE